MSALVDYMSSSEEDEENDHVETEQRQSPEKPALSPRHSDPKEDKTSQHQPLSVADYFGIDGSDSDSAEDDVDQSSFKAGITKSDNDKTRQPGIELPTSQFWKGQRPITYEWKSHLSEEPDTSVPYKHSSYSSMVIPSQSNNFPTRKRKITDSQISLTSVKKMLKGDQRVKFYVHHRIKPVLYQQTGSKLPSVNKLYIPNAHSSAVNSLSWNKGQFSHMLLTSSMDKTVKVWNAFSKDDTGPLATYAVHDKAVKQAIWCSDGKQFLTASYDKTCRLLDVETGRQLNEFDHSSFVSCIASHPLQQNVFVAGSTNHIMAWDKREPKKPVQKFTYKDRLGQVQSLAFIQNGAQLVSCNDMVTRESTDTNIMAWDFKSGAVLSNQIYQERFTCTRILPHPTTADFIAQSQGNYMAIFSTVRPYKMNKCKRFEGHKVAGYNIGCSFSADGKYLYSGSSDGKLYMYDYYRDKLCRTLPLSPGAVCMDVASHPVLPSALAAGTWGGDIWLWE